ncbi:MAG TPA: ribosome maturation factor RimM [Fibrobacteria bacterium]|nr:ribosome maturation factor RimM [Fibrobacteria bacterium]
MNAPPDNLILIGYTQKPYGLLGELKVSPATFDFDRHTGLSTVYFRKRDGDAPEALEVRATRADAENWYLKFKDLRTPEAVARLSGGQLLIPAEERLELPEDMVYLSDVPGMIVIDEEGKTVGKVVEVLEQGAQELLVVGTGRQDMLIPWNDHFVKRIDKTARQVLVDISTLRGIL